MNMRYKKSPKDARQTKGSFDRQMDNCPDGLIND